MPTLEENLSYWEQDCDWSQRGEEWSVAWGGSESQWWGTILPRIHAFVPCASILEIAPGYGRWTHFLKELGQKLAVVDLSDRCIEHCRHRFASSSHISYWANDGRSLAMIPDQSVDFAFSFDSLVHAEADVLEAYVGELARILTPQGVGFLHHSNAAPYAWYFTLFQSKRWAGGSKEAGEPEPSQSERSMLRRALSRVKHGLIKARIIANDHSRGMSMSADHFQRFCDQSGLRCIGQELTNGDGRMLIDCFSTFTRPGSVWDRPYRRVENHSFPEEIRRLSAISDLYRKVEKVRPPGMLTASK